MDIVGHVHYGMCAMSRWLCTLQQGLSIHLIWCMRRNHLSISAILASVEAVREGLLDGGVLLGGPPCLGGKRAPAQLLAIFFQLLLCT